MADAYVVEVFGRTAGIGAATLVMAVSNSLHGVPLRAIEGQLISDPLAAGARCACLRSMAASRGTGTTVRV